MAIPGFQDPDFTSFELDQASHVGSSGTYVSDEELICVSGFLQNQIGTGLTGFPNGWVHDLTLSYINAAQVQLGSGVCRDSEDFFDIRSDTDLTASITSVGASGLDTGSEAADTWYAVHLIADSTSINSPAALLSVSSHNPTLPVGYDKFRRVGWVRNDGGSDFLKFLQIWDANTKRVVYDEIAATTRVLSGANATTFTSVDLSSFIPVTSRNAMFLSEFETGSTGSELHEVKYRPAGFSAATNDSLWQQRTADISANKSRMQIQLPCVGQSIEYRVDNVINLVSLSVAGYDDEL